MIATDAEMFFLRCLSGEYRLVSRGGTFFEMPLAARPNAVAQDGRPLREDDEWTYADETITLHIRPEDGGTIVIETAGEHPKPGGNRRDGQ